MTQNNGPHKQKSKGNSSSFWPRWHILLAKRFQNFRATVTQTT